MYILRCADGTYYTGWTTDVARRVTEHNAGRGSRYTRSRGPVTLVYQEQLSDPSAAKRREAAIKKYTRAQKEQLVARGVPHKAVPEQ